MYKFLKDSKLCDPKFLFGVATASYQIEGATSVDERCPSIWDTFCAKPGAVYKQHNGDVACDHYHLYQDDVNLIASLGMGAYRLSMAWPRIIKSDGSINQKGLDFYDRVISALEEKNLTIMATLYHWDLPQYLDDEGGWLNRETAYKYAEYVEVVSSYFGDRIDFYATLNEPWCSAFHGYRDGKHAPGITDDRSAFLASHNLLLAHGLAVPILRKNAPSSKHGIVLNFTPAYPANESAKDVADFADEYNHWFIKPIMEGEYPESVYQHYIDVMPTIEDGDMGIINAKIDFLGVNNYSRGVIDQDGQYPNYKEVHLSDVERTHIGWEVYPEGLLKLLTDLNQTYQLPPIYITENGAAVDDQVVDGAVEDEQRCRYYQNHLSSVDQAIRKGVDIRGYFAWSLMDNFEWAEGYKMRFGIVYVDYKTQKRIPKRSALWFKEFLDSRQQ
ncbi:MAG: GH1 family beta-glucosidase [Candidatus Thioglobus sp.]|nr:GH1 family beta-glucosidase [Candidatus Thioglobus sp.]